jgi:ABC-type tungstate transport system permease subunit
MGILTTEIIMGLLMAVVLLSVLVTEAYAQTLSTTTFTDDTGLTWSLYHIG